MKIAVVGTGYVGLTTAVFLAESGQRVVGLDIDREKIAALQRGEVPFYEPGLAALLTRLLAEHRLFFTVSSAEAVRGAKVVFVCVGTPSKSGGEIDLQAIKKACLMIAREATGSLLVVIKSTVPPGVQKKLIPLLAKSKYSLELATCPEFLREGSAVWDIFHPDRVIIGAQSVAAARLLTRLHQAVKAPIHVMDVNSAQMVKYSANAFLANKISFANQIANLCDLVEADAAQVMTGLGLDSRIGPRFLRPGIGFGGSCFPKDTKALVSFAIQYGLDLKMVKTAIQINDEQVAVVLQKVKKLVGSWRGKKVAVLGLAFKPETDDLREARSLVLIKELLRAGATVAVYDPVAMPAAREKLGKRVVFAASVLKAVGGASCLVLVTEWPQFKVLPWAKVKQAMKSPNIVDARNFWEPAKLKVAGFRYLGIGRR